MAAYVAVTIATDLIPELIHKIETGSAENARRWAEEVLSDAQGRAPYRTGTLRGSGYVHYSSNGAELGFLAPYAGYVENGTRYMAARPYMAPAWYAGLARFADAFKDMFEV